MSAGISSTRLAALLATDIVGSAEHKSRAGVEAYSAALRRHNDLFEAACESCGRPDVLKHTGDGYFAAFGSISDAIRVALLFQHALEHEVWPSQLSLSARVGVHVGQVAIVEMAGHPDIVGLSVDLAARVMGLASGGQILLTEPVFNEARQFVREHPTRGTADVAELKWTAHGAYRFKGADDPVSIYEVGVRDQAVGMPPRDSPLGWRLTTEQRALIAGWRPAAGIAVPHRLGWNLDKRIGEGSFGEAWLASHHRTRERRVFKFCHDAEKLQSFKRELTIFRLIRKQLGERQDIARIFDINLDDPPFFLESEYVEGGSLAQWGDAHGGIGRVALTTRLKILADLADAVAAAHSVNVVHKDIKPSNILICERPGGSVQPKLSDFGIGMLTSRQALASHDITETGFGSAADTSSTRGPWMYAAPELQTGEMYTVQADIYSLGVLIFQAAVADFKRPLAVGWERGINDPFLRELITDCVDGDLDRRLSSAARVGVRLRELAAGASTRDASRSPGPARNASAARLWIEPLPPRSIEATAMFTDISGFSRNTAQMSPEATLVWLDGYLTEMAELIGKHAGIVSKFLGDGIFAIFGAPEPTVDKGAPDAVRCALEMRSVLKGLNGRWLSNGLPGIGMRIGIESGPMTIGTIGEAARLELHVLGATVNRASRLEGYDGSFEADTDERRCRILIGEATRAALPATIATRPAGKWTMTGADRPQAIYEVIGEVAQ